MLDMHEDCATWLKFASLCRKSGRVSQSEQTLVRLLSDVRADSEARGLLPLSPGSHEPQVLYAWFKHLWATGARQEAFAGVQHLAAELGAAAAALAAAAASAGEGAVVQPDPAHLLLAAKVRAWRAGGCRGARDGMDAFLLSCLGVLQRAASVCGCLPPCHRVTCAPPQPLPCPSPAPPRCT